MELVKCGREACKNLFEKQENQGKLYCSDNCRKAENKRLKRLKSRTSDAGVATLLKTSECGRYSCPNRFTPKSVSQKYCSESCRAGAEKDRKNLEMIEDLKEVDPVDVAARKNEVVIELDRQVGVLQRALLKAESRTEVVINRLEEWLNNSERAPRFTFTPRGFSEGSGRATEAVLCISDTQCGKWVNDIGIKVLMDQYFPAILQKLIECVTVQRYEGKVEKLIVALIGDLIEGCIIFASQRMYLDKYKGGDSTIDQVLIMADMLAAFLAEVRGYFKEVAVTSAYGNHGRTAKKDDPNLNKDNYDRLVFEILKRTCTNLDIEFIEPIDDRFVFNSMGYYVGGIHGHQLGYKSSLNSMELTTLRWDAIRHFGGVPLDVMLLGHKHHAASLEMQGIEVIQNAAMDGGSPWLTDTSGIWSPPSQELIFFSEKFGVDSRHRLYLTEREPRHKKLLVR